MTRRHCQETFFRTLLFVDIARRCESMVQRRWANFAQWFSWKEKKRATSLICFLVLEEYCSKYLFQSLFTVLFCSALTAHACQNLKLSLHCQSWCFSQRNINYEILKFDRKWTIFFSYLSDDIQRASIPTWHHKPCIHLPGAQEHSTTACVARTFIITQYAALLGVAPGSMHLREWGMSNRNGQTRLRSQVSTAIVLHHGRVTVPKSLRA